MPENTALELVISFNPIAPDAPDDAPVGFSVRCPQGGGSWDGGQFVNPLDDATVTGEIRWYLEEYWKWPTDIDRERAHKVEAGLGDWGRALFNAVFDRREPARIYEAFLNHEADRRRVVIEAQAPRVQSIPWELLAESSGPLAMKRTPISISRRVHLEHAPAVRTFALPLRVLMAVSRPEGAGFIDPRSTARGMLDALKPLLETGQIVVDFLRPPTLKALDDALRKAERANRPYHIVHFDGHGVYHRHSGLGQLAFEHDDASLDLVDADRLGSLLQECGVPLMILEACQSAQGDQANPFSSVATRMIEAGIGGVLSMSHSVLVVTAGMFVNAFYRALTEGYTVGQATDEARRALVQDTRRLSLERMGRAGTLDLHDWFLPVLYQQQADAAPFAEAVTIHHPTSTIHHPTSTIQHPAPDPYAPLETAMRRLLDQLTQADPRTMDALTLQHRLAENLALTRTDGDTEIRRSDRAAILRSLDALALKSLGLPFEMLGEQPSPDSPPHAPTPTPPHAHPLLHGLPPEPTHGFVGRARELLAIERRFRDHGIVVLHGWGGVGKTALSAEAARWFTRTGLVREAVFVSFEHCQSADYALAEVGRALVEDNFNVGQAAGDPVERIGAALQRHSGAAFPALVIFDNFESALGRDALLGADDLRAVLDAAKAWARTGARVLITTRDVTFGDAALAPGKLTAHHELTGLSAPDALDLAAKILKNHGIDRAKIEREALQRLLTALHGHPLSLELVLQHLKDRTPAQLCDEFGALLAEFRSGRGEQRNESLLVSLDFSLRRLDDATRVALPDLAVFEGGVLEPLICGSHGFPQITGMDEAAWRAARAALESAALLTAEPLPGVTVPYIHFHPTLLPYLREQLPSPDGEGPGEGEILARYQQAYVALSRYLYQSDRQNPTQARAIAARELPNLRRALDLTLQAGDFETAADLADSICRFLDVFGRAREREQVVERITNYGLRITEQGITHGEYLMLWRQGEGLLGAGRAGEAEGVFRELLARLDAGAAFDAGYQRCVVLGSIGQCLRTQGKPGAAEEVYRGALEATEALEQTETVQRHAGGLHTDLGDVLRDLGRYAEARAEYEAGLKVARETKDERQQSVVLTQLGTLALQERDLPEARRRYQEALEFDLRVGDPRDQAIDWHQLGMVAQEGRDWPEAERCYKESLAIKERIGDKAGAATTCNQLAIVAKNAGRPDEAERWYTRAIALGEELNYVGELGKWYSNLANLLLAQGRLDEAERYAHRAREIKERLDLSVEPWTTYTILAQIAAQRGRAAEARDWRRKARDTFAAFPGSWARLEQRFAPVVAAVVAATKGDQQARAQVEAAFPGFESGNWQIVDAIQRIWAGERDLDALTEDVDRNSALIIRKILERIAGVPPVSPASATQPASQHAGGTPAPQQGLTLDQLLALVARARAGDAALAAQLQPVFQVMASSPDAPPELRPFFAALAQVLGGETPDLSALPPELADVVRQLL